MKSQMDASDKVRIAYAAKYAQTANYWKYFIGQTKGLKRMRVADQKAATEKQFQTWADADASRKAKYGNVVGELKKSFADIEKYAVMRTYLNEAINRGPEILTFAYGANDLNKELNAKPHDKAKVKSAAEKLSARGEDYFKEYDATTDQMLLSSLLKMYYNDVPKEQHAPVFAEIQSKYKGDFDKWAADVFENSLFASKAKYDAFLKSPSSKKLAADPAFKTISSIMDHYMANLKPSIDAITAVQTKNNRLFVAGLREMMPEKKFAPDANGTMRLSYGQVKDYDPMDAVDYNYFTTANGILEKMDNSNEEFIVDPKLEKLIRDKDFGPYGENGQLKVCFISTNDITGGNSGSPVINGNGELVGLCFDGNWEAMSGDIAYDPDYKRTISVDIRYVLFVIDKFAGASHLVKEMKLVN
jgi:Peptidase S46